MMSARFRLADGRQLAWRERGAGPAVVLIHGWAMSGRVFTELAARLSREHRVLMPDLPGHGASSASDRYTLEQMAVDLAAWLHGVVSDPAVVCGWSLGGMVAMQMAADGVISPKRLMLMATTPRFTKSDDWACGLSAAEVKLLERNLTKDGQKTFDQFFNRMLAGEPMPPGRLRAIRKSAIDPGETAAAGSARATLRIFADQDQRRLLNRILCPVMILHGGEDRIIPVEAGRFLAEAIPQARLKEYPASGHAPFLGLPGEVADDIRSLLQWSR